MDLRQPSDDPPRPRTVPFTRSHFLQHRPYLYHYTAPGNLDRLRADRAMHSAAAWVARANAHRPQIADVHAFLGTARERPVSVEIAPGESIILNDQRPLRNPDAFYALCGTYEDFIRLLNGLVFFWPGRDVPTPKGDLAASFAKRYAAYGCLRVRTEDVWLEGTDIRFCDCNSGAPQLRDRLTRGPQIFVEHTYRAIELTRVAEVVFRNSVSLPASTEWKSLGTDAWSPLFQNPQKQEP